MNKAWLCLAIGCLGLASPVREATAGVPTPDMDERTLQEKYHIAPTAEGLIGALRHEDAAVRSFAALKLADDGDKEAIGPILQALAAEKIQGVQIGLAVSAAQLGSQEGFNALTSMCADRSWSPTMRMTAAQTMVNFLGPKECLPDILDVLRSETDDPTIDGIQAPLVAMNLLPLFKQAAPAQLDEMRDLCGTYLKSQNPGIRMYAGMCIRDLGGPWAIQRLRAAMDAEREAAVRSSLEKDLLSVKQ